MIGFTLRLLFHREETARHFFDRTVGGPQSQSKICENGNISCLCRESISDSSTVHPIARSFADLAIAVEEGIALTL
jgi:hypothetical protein